MFKPTLIALAALASTPALAGQCPAGKQGDNPLANAPTAPSKVTDVVVGDIDLGQEQVSASGYDLRLRRLVVQPGGVVPTHNHKARPAVITVVSGQITEHRSSCRVPILHRAGSTVMESGDITHWWKNHGKTPAVLYSADVKPKD